MNKIIVVSHMGVGGQRGRIYHPDGIAPCISSTTHKDATKIVVKYESNRVRIPRERDRKTSE